MGNATRARLDIGHLRHTVQAGLRVGTIHAKELWEAGFGRVATVTVEDLSAYEWIGGNATGFNVSVVAWSKVLTAVSVNHTLDGVEQFLQGAGMFSRPVKSQRDTVYNFDEVEAELRGTEWAWMLH